MIFHNMPLLIRCSIQIFSNLPNLFIHSCTSTFKYLTLSNLFYIFFSFFNYILNILVY